MATKTKKSSKTAKANEVEKEMLIIDFCPIHFMYDIEVEANRMLRELKNNTFSILAEMKEPIEQPVEAVADTKKEHWFTKVKNWCKGLFKKK